MARAGLQQGSWVLICDGRKALFLENMGDHIYPKLVTRQVVQHKDPPTHDLGSDVPGRVFSGKGGRHSAIEPTDVQSVAEQKFLTAVARRLSREVEEGHVRKLILAAPARSLAVLREKLSAVGRKAVVAEFDKDFVRMPVYEIERHLKRLLSGRS